MKYCGVVTDRSWYESVREETGERVIFQDTKTHRIYTDEVPMADDDLIETRRTITALTSGEIII